MSHSVFITTDGKKRMQHQCDHVAAEMEKMLEQISLTSKVAVGIRKKVEAIRNQQNELMKFSDEINDVKISSDFQKKLSTLTKEGTNLLRNSSIIGTLIDFKEEQRVEIETFIMEQGYKATIAYRNLENNNYIVNMETLREEMDKIKNKNLEKEELDLFIKKNMMYIKDLDLDDSLAFALINKLKSYKTPEGLTDFQSFVSEKEFEVSEINSLAKSMFKELTKYDFKMGKYEYKLNDKGIVVGSFILKDKAYHELKINIDGANGINYKLGNYEGHACEKTSVKIWNFLDENGYGIIAAPIIRDVNEEPLSKAQKLYEGDK